MKAEVKAKVEPERDDGRQMTDDQERRTKN
jgi:hypothetical protein